MPTSPQLVESPTPGQSDRAPQAFQWLDRVSESLAASVGRRTIWYLIGLSALYLIGTSALASSKLFWFDEILTFHIARTPTLASLWATMRSGLDLNPPFYFIVMQFTRSLIGESELAMRIPVLIGFWVMGLCLFRFVSRGCGPLYGLVALLLPVSTTAYNYAFEARPYGLVLGLCGVALVCWQSYARDDSRLGLAIMWLCLTAAISSHYYAVMALLPLAAGEMVRIKTRKKWDFKVLGALALSGIPILFGMAQFRMARTYAITFWWKPSILSFLTFYDFLVGPGQFVLVIGLLLVAIMSIPQRWRSRVELPQNAPTAAESVVATGFVLLPYVAILFAVVIGNAFAPRYVLPSVIGVATFLPIAAYTVSGGRKAIGAALAIVVFLAFSVREISASRRFLNGREPLEAYNFLSDNTSGLPIVMVNPLEFIKVAHYGSAEWRRRAAYVVALSDSVRYGESDTADRALVLLRKVTPLNVFDYADFARAHPKFLVFGADSWEIRYLSDHAADIRVVGKYGKNLLFEVQAEPDKR